MNAFFGRILTTRIHKDLLISAAAVGLFLSMMTDWKGSSGLAGAIAALASLAAMWLVGTIPVRGTRSMRWLTLSTLLWACIIAGDLLIFVRLGQ